MKKLLIFVGTVLLLVGLLHLGSADFPTKGPYGKVSRDFRFMKDVQIDGDLNVDGTFVMAGGITPGGDITLADDEQVLFGDGTDASIDFDDDDNALVIGVPINGQQGIILGSQPDVAADFNWGGLVTTTQHAAIAFVDDDTDHWLKIGHIGDDEPFVESMSGDLQINPNYEANVTFFEGVNANGENPTITISGYQTDTAARTFTINVDATGNPVLNAQIAPIKIADAVAYTRQGTTNHWTYQGALADDASFNLPAITNGAVGWVVVGNNEERSDFTIDNDGDVTLVDNSANVVANADTDGKFCLGTAATQEPLVVRNRLAAEKNVILILYYD